MKKIRVGCSVRVSHEEQARDGLSIQTQIDHLKTYIANHKELVLVDFYVDEGVSADKLKKRTEMQRLLRDVQDGKVDMILFTKLDRWFRSVQKYYEVQSILDKHNCNWKAILEDYETETASGRFKVNIMLSVAQNEREKTSERIKDVFQYKVKNGEALYGDGAVPFGFTTKVIDGKRRIVHKKEEEEILKVLLKHYYTFQSVRKTIKFARSEYDLFLSYNRFHLLLKNPLLYGCYRDNANYCEPYITKTRFDEIQAILKKNIRVRSATHEHLFSSMLVCPCCGRYLIGTVSYYTSASGERKCNLGYRCDSYWNGKRKICTFGKSKSQKRVEKDLLNNIVPMLESYIIECEAKEKAVVKKPINREKIQAELDRLNNMYLKGRISEEVYDNKYTELNKKLLESVDIPKYKKDARNEIKALTGINLHELYNTFDDAEKRTFLRGIINKIFLDENCNITEIEFL